MTLVRGGLLTLLATLALAPAAQAAQRFASPSGSGVECGPATPCSLAEAVSKAKTGDEVIVGTGIYSVVEGLFPEAGGVDIHGDYGSPMPTIRAAFSGTVIGSSAGGRVAHLAVDNLSPNAGGVQCVKAIVERVSVKVSGKRSVGVGAVADCIVRDSLLLASGEESTGLAGVGFEDGHTGFVRNVTAIATGPESVGLQSEYGPALAGGFTLDIRNTIAEGGAADLHAMEGFSGPGNIVVAGSNYDRPKQDFGAKITDAGGNQAVAPLFVDVAGGDYREAGGSPTIDAGALDPQVGGSDLLGSPRVGGVAPDIGAFEYVPAAAPPPGGRITALRLTPRRFRAVAFGEPTGGGILKSHPPGRTGGSFTLTAPAMVTFTISRALRGRRVGGKCKRPTKANRSKRKCNRYRQLRGGFSLGGIGGKNSFTLSGRLSGKTLPRGRYRLTGAAGGVSKSAPFEIVGIIRPTP